MRWNEKSQSLEVIGVPSLQTMPWRSLTVQTNPLLSTDHETAPAGSGLKLLSGRVSDSCNMFAPGALRL